MTSIINHRIKEKEVVVIDQNGNNLGLKKTPDALAIAEDAGLDLVVVQNKTNPVICKIMDYNRAVYEQKKKEKERKKLQKEVELKTIQLSYRIDSGDFNRKVEKAKEELKEGNRVYVVLRLKGRENSYANIGLGVVQRFCESLSDIGTVSKAAKLDGRAISATIEKK